LLAAETLDATAAYAAAMVAPRPRTDPQPPRDDVVRTS
jgi:hypothetical protein